MQAITDKEAWGLFRIAELSEAASWLLLLVGMYFKYVIKPSTDTLVAIGGSIHGTIFLGYLAALIGVWRILRLTPWQALVALLASIVPFGTLAFERWLAGRRQNEAYNSFRQIVVRGIIKKNDEVLAIQSKDVGFWSLPGGTILAGESTEAALGRCIEEQTGVVPKIGAIKYAHQYNHRSLQRMELIFEITNFADYTQVPFKPVQGIEIERIIFLNPRKEPEFRPDFLR